MYSIMYNFVSLFMMLMEGTVDKNMPLRDNNPPTLHTLIN